MNPNDESNDNASTHDNLGDCNLGEFLFDADLDHHPFQEHLKPDKLFNQTLDAVDVSITKSQNQPDDEMQGSQLHGNGAQNQQLNN